MKRKSILFKELITLKYIGSFLAIVGFLGHLLHNENETVFEIIFFAIGCLGSILMIIGNENTDDERTKHLRLLAYRDILVAILVIGIIMYVANYFYGIKEISITTIICFLPSIYILRVFVLKQKN